LVAYKPFWFGTRLRLSNLPQNSNTMNQLNLPQQPVLEILENCCMRYEPCTVYILGHHNSNIIIEQISKTANWAVHHFYLLVITAKQIPATGSIMANSIHELSGKTITATVMLHKPTDLATKHPHQIHFFNQALRFGHRLCLDKDYPPYLVANTIPPLNREEDTAFWLKCQAVALFNIQAAKENPQQGVELCKIALLNTACTQIALGLIRVLLHYTPNEFGLKHLLQLCNYCTLSDPNCHSREGGNPLPAAFNPKTMADCYRFNCLCAPPSLLNHRLHLNAPEEDFIYLLTATQDFLNQATLHITQNLELATRNPQL